MPTVLSAHFTLPPELQVEEHGFFSQKLESHTAFMEEDLARSGLVPEDMGCFVHKLMPMPHGGVAVYGFPYHYPDGSLIRVKGEIKMYRVRYMGGTQRYDQPNTKELDLIGLTGCTPYLNKTTLSLLADHKTLYICEGEKKSASFMKYIGRPAIGIGGCAMWRERGGSTVLHSWIKEMVATHGVEEVVIIPDADVTKNYIVEREYSALGQQIKKLGILSSIVQLPDKDENGIDDLIMGWGIEAEAMFDELPKLNPLLLAEQPEMLAKRFGLGFSTGTKGAFNQLYDNESNINILLENHPAFEDQDFWHNRDTNDYMHGKNTIVWEITEQEIGGYFQRNLGMPRVPVKRVCAALTARGLSNERSPFFDKLAGLRGSWDLKERLETWAIRLWGCEDTPATREVSKKFFVSYVARQMNPGCKVDWMMIAYGGQGIGKTWFAEIVSEGTEVPYIATGNPVDNATKLHCGTLICFDEVQAFGKADAEFWKQMLTATKDIVRRPYGRGEVTLVRSSIIYGNTNHKHFLRKDTTGQRRFGVINPLRMLDYVALKEELDQLWAEALAVYDSGECEYYGLSLETIASTEAEHQAEDVMSLRAKEFLEMFWPAERFRIMDFLRYIDKEHEVQNAAITGKLPEIFAALGVTYKRSTKLGKGTTKTLDLHQLPYKNTDYAGPGYIIDRSKRPFLGK